MKIATGTMTFPLLWQPPTTTLGMARLRVFQRPARAEQRPEQQPECSAAAADHTSDRFSHMSPAGGGHHTNGNLGVTSRSSLSGQNSETFNQVLQILESNTDIGFMAAKSIMRRVCNDTNHSSGYLMPRHIASLIPPLQNRLKLYLPRSAEIQSVIRKIRDIADGPRSEDRNVPFKIAIDHEGAVQKARITAGRMAETFGFNTYARSNLSTVVSELARNIWRYAGGEGMIELSQIEGGIQLTASDRGPGIPKLQLDEIFSGNYKSKTGLGKGIAGTRNTMTTFDIQTAEETGTTITATK